MGRPANSFIKTHRVLIKSTEEDFKYYTVEIDINSGYFKKTTVDSKDTKIRVNSNIFGEYFAAGDTHPLSDEDIIRIEGLFNAVRATREWAPVEFRRTKEVENEVSNTPEIQGQETT